MKIELKGVTKSFGEKTLFRDFSYRFNDTGIYALTGESGVGKTTLLRIISGLDKEFSGEVIGGGKNNVSYCFQEHRLFPELTALDNITRVSFEKPTDSDVKSTKNILLRLKFTEEDMKLLPRELSGGMRQRVAFARAVMLRRPILILDEATKELDSESLIPIFEIIKEESKKRLVIIVTHKNDEIEALGATAVPLN